MNNKQKYNTPRIPNSSVLDLILVCRKNLQLLLSTIPHPVQCPPHRAQRYLKIVIIIIARTIRHNAAIRKASLTPFCPVQITNHGGRSQAGLKGPKPARRVNRFWAKHSRGPTVRPGRRPYGWAAVREGRRQGGRPSGVGR